MGFSDKVQAEALAACERRCCICHNFCGTKMALHHIVQRADGGDDSFDNCIPLCLNCHEDMGKPDPRHVTGKHYSERELRLHRDNWYEKVKNSRDSINTSMEILEVPNAAGGNTVIIGEGIDLYKQALKEATNEIHNMLNK